MSGGAYQPWALLASNEIEVTAIQIRSLAARSAAERLASETCIGGPLKGLLSPRAEVVGRLQGPALLPAPFRASYRGKPSAHPAPARTSITCLNPYLS
jgi:hypothetical protein